VQLLYLYSLDSKKNDTWLKSNINFLGAIFLLKGIWILIWGGRSLFQSKIKERRWQSTLALVGVSQLSFLKYATH